MIIVWQAFGGRATNRRSKRPYKAREQPRRRRFQVPSDAIIPWPGDYSRFLSTSVGEMRLTRRIKSRLMTKYNTSMPV